MLPRRQLGRRARHALSAISLRMRLISQTLRARAMAMRAAPLLAFFALLCLLFVAVATYLANLLLLRPLGHILFTRSGLTARPAAAAPPHAPPGHASFSFSSLPVLSPTPAPNYAALPLRRPEADLVLAHLRRSDVYLEFGASGATLAFPQRVAAAFAVEHRPRVCAVLSSELSAHADQLGALRAFCAPAEPTRGGFRAHMAFVDVPRNNLSHIRFDAVLLNGPARLACALRVLPQLAPDARVFFPGFFSRPAHHAPVLRYYDEIARVRARAHAGGGLLVLRPKPRFVAAGDPVDEDDIHAMYDAARPETPAADSAADFRWVQRPLQGGFDYYAMTQAMSRKSARMRLVLDCVALPIVAAMWAALQRLFLRFFLPLVAAAGNGATAASPARSNGPVPQKREKVEVSSPEPRAAQAAAAQVVSASATESVLPKAD